MKKIYIIGIGPGNEEFMTMQARQCIEDSDIICGYTVYVDLVKPVFPDKETYATGMLGEKTRCQWALEKANEGNTIAFVCSGDSGLYGMAGLIYELGVDYPEVELVTVPGITAALSGSAVLGSPVGMDFCTISLSDRLTKMEQIEDRLYHAALADFIICIYNPDSKTRKGYLKKACEIIMKAKSPETVCGWVKNIGRDGQEYKVTTLEKLGDEPIDMFTTVFIGSSRTLNVNGKMITPRGYIEKYGK